MGAASIAYVRVRLTTYAWIEVPAIDLDSALDEARAHGYEPETAQWDKPEMDSLDEIKP